MSSSESSYEAIPFNGFTAEEVAAICTAGKLRQCEAGDVLFRRDEYGDSMFVLEEGEVELNFANEVSSKSLCSNAVFGELAFVTGRHLRTATARAKTHCTLRVIDETAFERLYQSQPRLLVRLLRHTCGYLLASEHRLIGSLRRKNRELQSTLDYLRRTREEVDYQELLANTDELTGLYNRRCLNQQLDKFIDRAHATGTGLALILVDVDKFKDVNDTFGHAAGDEVLQGLAAIITECVRTSDLPCRFGGDEFAIVLTEIEPDRAVARAESIRRNAQAARLVPDHVKIEVCTSIGGAMLRPRENASELFERADQELYRSKKLGRNRVCWQGQEIQHLSKTGL